MKITLEKLKQELLKEDLNGKRFGYHCTNVDPEIIKRDGFKVGSGFTIDNQFEDLYNRYLPENPVFITKEGKLWDKNAKYILKIDISDLKLYPDFGSLSDYGAYYDNDNEEFYWEDIEDIIGNEDLREFIDSNYQDLTMPASDFTGEDSLNTLGTACIDSKDLINRIVRIIEK